MVGEWIWSSLDDTELQMLLKIALRGEKAIKRLLSLKAKPKEFYVKASIYI